MADHVHMLVLIPPKISVSSFMGYLKGKSALMMFDKHANLKYKFGNRHFWSEGYYVSTVGLNEATVKKYIREQELHDQMKDKHAGGIIGFSTRRGETVNVRVASSFMRIQRMMKVYRNMEAGTEMY